MGCNNRRRGGVFGNSFTTGSGDTNGVGLVETYQLSGKPCNVEYIYIYIATAMPAGDRWVHLFDMIPTIPAGQTLSQVLTGQAPLYMDKVPAAGNVFVWEPPSDYTVHFPAAVNDDNGKACAKVEMPVGAPFDRGVLIGFSSTEFTFTPGGAFMWITGRINEVECKPVGDCRR